jgi:chromosome partitioning protein
MVDNRTNYAKDICQQVYDAYSSSVNVFAVEIPMSVRAAEISAEGSSIYVYDPKGKAAFAYTSLIKEVIDNGR